MAQIELMWGNELTAETTDRIEEDSVASRSGRRCPDFFIFLVVVVGVDEGTILIRTAHQHSLLADLVVLKMEDQVTIQNAFDEEGEMALPMLTMMTMGGDTDGSDHEDADIEHDMGVAVYQFGGAGALYVTQFG
uniref:Uncharacterized protein n=1 Tax=Leersia perrieri TaxID=77586 RepID=A0A0D9Y116_9ORYZ